MKVGDEVYLRDDPTVNGVINLSNKNGFVVSWGPVNSGFYKESELILASECEKENMKPAGHQNASILMEIAKEAAINPNPINQFLAIRITDKLTRRACYEDFRLLLSNELEADWEIRRKPRTIRIGNYDVPEFKARKYKGSLSQNSIVVELDDAEGAELMLKALQELLAGK